MSSEDVKSVTVEDMFVSDGEMIMNYVDLEIDGEKVDIVDILETERIRISTARGTTSVGKTRQLLAEMEEKLEGCQEEISQNKETRDGEIGGITEEMTSLFSIRFNHGNVDKKSKRENLEKEMKKRERLSRKNRR